MASFRPTTGYSPENEQITMEKTQPFEDVLPINKKPGDFPGNRHELVTYGWSNHVHPKNRAEGHS